VSSVAYPAQPTEPGWWRTAWLIVVGWLTAGLVLAVLYLAGSFVGAIGRNIDGLGQSGIHGINDWPFPANGNWSLVADASVFALALLITTVAIAWNLRSRFATVAEDRLFVVLLFTVGAPFVTSHKTAPLLFVIAVWAVRAWVVKDELRMPRRPLLLVGAALALTIASYGLAHPVWIESASATSPATKRPTVVLVLHNQGRVAVDVEQVIANGRHEARVGWPWADTRRLPVRIGPGRSDEFTVKVSAGDCGGVVGRIRYRVLGATRSEPLETKPSGFPACA
jgi:hypothetical protein